MPGATTDLSRVRVTAPSVDNSLLDHEVNQCTYAFTIIFALELTKLSIIFNSERGLPIEGKHAGIS